VRDGDTFDLYDIESLAPTTHVTLAELGDDRATVLRVGDATVVLTTAQALLLDGSGAIVERVPLPAGDAAFAPYGLVFGDRVAMPMPSGLVVLRVTATTMREVWRRDAYALDVLADGPRPLVALAFADPTSMAGVDVPTAVVDLASGATVWTGLLDRPRGGGRVLTATGFAAIDSTRDHAEARRAIVGIDPDGRTMWTQAIAATSYTVVGTDALISVQPTVGLPDSTTVTLFG